MFDQITAVTRCEECGRLGELKISLAGDFGSGTRVGVGCECGGRMMTIGRYGSEEIDGDLVTVLVGATEAELAAIAAAIQAVGGATVEDVADRVTALDTPTARTVGDWIRENGGWFVAAAAIAEVINALVSVGGAHDDSHDINIDRIVIRDDGQVTIGEQPPSE